MKKTLLLLSILLVMIAWYPILIVWSWVNHYTVAVLYPQLTFGVLTLLYAALSLWLLLTKMKTVNAATSVLSGLLTTFSPVWLLTVVWENTSFFLFCLALVWVFFSFALLICYGKNPLPKGITVGASTLLLIPLVLLLLLATFFQIGERKVVQRLPSPEGTYYAELIDDDQGALGGDTLVYVYDTRQQYYLGLLMVQKNPQQIFMGQWGLFETMQLEWESEQILKINGVAHEVD